PDGLDLLGEGRGPLAGDVGALDVGGDHRQQRVEVAAVEGVDELVAQALQIGVDLPVLGGVAAVVEVDDLVDGVVVDDDPQAIVSGRVGHGGPDLRCAAPCTRGLWSPGGSRPGVVLSEPPLSTCWGSQGGPCPLSSVAGGSQGGPCPPSLLLLGGVRGAHAPPLFTCWGVSGGPMPPSPV